VPGQAAKPERSRSPGVKLGTNKIGVWGLV
jgi:hypothetical protein